MKSTKRVARDLSKHSLPDTRTSPAVWREGMIQERLSVHRPPDIPTVYYSVRSAFCIPDFDLHPSSCSRLIFLIPSTWHSIPETRRTGDHGRRLAKTPWSRNTRPHAETGNRQRRRPRGSKRVVTDRITTWNRFFRGVFTTVGPPVHLLGRSHTAATSTSQVYGWKMLTRSNICKNYLRTLDRPFVNLNVAPSQVQSGPLARASCINLSFFH